MSYETEEGHLYREKAIRAVRWWPDKPHPKVRNGSPGCSAYLENGRRIMAVSPGDWIVELPPPLGPVVMDDRMFRATYECVTCPTSDSI